MASKRAIRRRACEGKKRHATAEDARAAIPWWFRGVHEYRCPHCSNWHTGHRPRRRNRKP